MIDTVLDKRENLCCVGDEVACFIGLAAAKIAEINPIVDGGPMTGGQVVRAVVEVQWVIPPPSAGKSGVMGFKIIQPKRVGD